MAEATGGDAAGARAHAQQLWQESGRQFEALVASVTLAVSITDLEGTVVRWNAAAERLFGWSEEEVIGRRFFDFHVPPEDRNLVGEFMANLLAGAPQKHTVHTNLTKSGGRVRIEWFSHVLRDREGKPIGILALAQDVTERERDSEMLRLMSSSVAYSTNAIMITREKGPDEAAPPIVYVNSAFEKLTGYSREEMLKATPRILHGPKTDRRLLDSLWRYFVEHKPFTIEIVHYRKNGTEYDARLTVFPTADEKGRFTHWVSIQEDITDLKRANERLTESENRYRRLVEEAGDVIYCADAAGRLTYFNPLVEKLTGFPASELQGRHFTKFCAPEWRERLLRFYVTQYRDATLETTCEFPVQRKDGGVRWVEQTTRLMYEGDQIVGFNCIMRDIHDRRMVQLELERYREQLEQLVEQRTQELRVALRRLKTLIKNVPGIVFRSDANRPGTMAFVSDGVRDLAGYSTEELTGTGPRPFIELIVAEDRAGYREAVLDRTSRDLPYEVEYRLKCADGTVKWVQEIGRAVLNESGSRVIEGVILDVNERKLAEAERQKAQEDLRQAQKMEAVGQLAGGIAHDFNNLLQVITTYTQFAMRSVPPESRGRKDLDQILKASRSATELTRKLLAFGRRQILQPVNVHLDEVVREVMGMLSRVIGENISLELIPGYDLCTINADPGQIEQVLVNLCVNARDALHNGGSITIKIKNVAVDEAMAEATPGGVAGDFVRLSVTDTGHGMTREVMDHIFEPFFTTKEVGKGTGMGLATVFGIVKQHGGFITVDSEVGAGTTFNLYFPVVAGTIRQADLRPVAQGEAPGGSERLLLAEDEEAVRESVIRVLTEAGYEVIAAVDGAQALELFQEHGDSIKLFVSDMVMPRMSGRDAYAEMARRRPGLPVLFTSGYSLGAATDFVLRDGMHIIHKPYDADDLLRRIREVLDG